MQTLQAPSSTVHERVLARLTNALLSGLLVRVGRRVYGCACTALPPEREVSA